jgi:N,N'-diacetyllegionaminate synthase
VSFPASFTVAERRLGDGAPTYVIAEIGANHDRDLGKARALIDAAADAGADAVKFQTYSGDRIYSRKTPSFRYLDPIAGDKSPAELLEEISLPREWQPLLADHARSQGVHFFSSPFDHEAVAELEAVGVPVMKIASFEIGDHGLIRRAAESGLPLFISTGMATLGEIEEALHAAAEGGAPAVALMQCTSLYPAPPESANLRAMETMRIAFNVPVGLSDHSTGIAVPIAAAALGAALVEKHFTLDRSSVGPDHPFALEPPELAAMIAGIREAQSALGDGRKAGPSDAEREEMYTLARRSLIISADLAAGTVLEREMITVKRPGFGIAPKFLDQVVGRTLRVDVEYDDILTWDML